MALAIDTSNPFRYPSELTRLVRAVHEASDNDEARWIEWKSTLDLAGSGAVHHLVRQILGFSNREPAVAERWAGGYGYILVGVSPGQFQGVKAVDPEQLVSKIRPYVGSEVVWTPEYVHVDGVEVLVVIVDPPRNGDMMRTLRKALPPYEAGTVLIRRPGQVERADPDEMLMLQRRLMAGTPQVDVSVVTSASLERVPDLQTAIEQHTERARQDCLSSLAKGLLRTPAVSLVGMPDRRSREDYVDEVNAYIVKLENALAARAVSRLFSHAPASLQVEVASGSDRPFTDIHLTIHLEGQVRGYEGDLYDLGAKKPPELPHPPKPFGTPSDWPVLPGQDLVHLRAAHIPAYDYSHLLRRGAVDWHVENRDGGVVIRFDPFDLRPSTPRTLPAVPLYVKAPAGDSLELTWTVTAGNANGKTSGRGQVRVVDPTVDLQRVFPAKGEPAS